MLSVYATRSLYHFINPQVYLAEIAGDFNHMVNLQVYSAGIYIADPQVYSEGATEDSEGAAENSEELPRGKNGGLTR